MLEIDYCLSRETDKKFIDMRTGTFNNLVLEIGHPMIRCSNQIRDTRSRYYPNEKAKTIKK